MKEPIRVLQVIGSLEIGGAQAMIINLQKSIDNNRVQFDYVIDRAEFTALAPIVEKMGSKVFVLPTFKGTNISEIRRAWDLFFLEHNEYKILHTHIRTYAALFIPVAQKHGVKCIVHSHSTSNGKGLKGAVKDLMQLPLRYQADYCFACSEIAGKWLFGKNIVYKSNYKVVPNAIDINLYKYNAEIDNKIRKQLGIQDRMTFIHVGRLHPSKNHLFLLNVFNEILKRISNACLILVGDGELRQSIEDYIAFLGIKDKVLLLGNRNDVPELLQAANMFLFPSIWEGLPVSVVEAQATGIPCIISNKVTNEVFISKLAKKVSIDNGIEPWVDAIMHSISKEKIDVSNQISEAGFDIRDGAEMLTCFYEEVANG